MSELAIEIRGLVKTFPSFQLGPLDLSVPSGAIYGLIGPNGAGKTTTIDLLLGMGRKNAGSMRVFGLDSERDEVAIKKRIGYVSPDLSFLPWGRVRKLVNFVRSFYDDWDDQYCRFLIERLKIDWNERISALSFGNRVKVSLLLALSHRPDLLLLDEPTAGLDAVSKQQIFSQLLSAVQDEQRTVLIASHGLADVERFTDHLGMIKDGRLLLQGSTGEIVDRFRMVDFVAAAGFHPNGVPGVFVQSQKGERWQALVDMQADAVERLKARGARDVSLSPVTLEDLFIALAKEED